MKKIFTLAVVAFCSLNISAQAIELLNLPKTAAEAEAAGYGKMWEKYDWGALVPAGTVLHESADVKLTMEANAFMAYAATKAGKGVYDSYLCMSSTLGNFVADPVLNPADVTNTSSGKQGGVITLEPTVDGKVTLAYSSGFNNRSMFVFDVTSTINEGYGAVILANNIEQGADKGDKMKADGVKDKVHTPTFDVVAGHKYYIVGSGTQQELYSVQFTSFMTDGYTPEIADVNTADAFLLNLPKTAAEAEAAGYGKMWEKYDWGALVPAGTVLHESADVKLTMEADAFMAYAATKAGKGVYDSYLCMSSTLGNFVADPVLNPADVTNTSSGKQGGVITLEPKADGKVTLYYSSGFNNRSIFVFDVTSTMNEGYGAVILANNIEQGADKGDKMKADGVKDKVHTPTFDVVAGHKYYIVGSGTQQELYQIAWTSFMTDKYVTAIENITANDVEKINDNKIYSIDGRYVGTKKESLANGLYIRNGKKFIKN